MARSGDRLGILVYLKDLLDNLKEIETMKNMVMSLYKYQNVPNCHLFTISQ